MPHLDEGRLQAWLDGARSGLSEAERNEITAHVAACERCAALLAEVRGTDVASRDLLGAMGAADTVMPDFSEIVARSRTGDSSATAPTPRHRRRLPLQWAASIVLAAGVGWMANEVARTDPGVVVPLDRSAVPSADIATPESAAGAAAASEPETTDPVSSDPLPASTSVQRSADAAAPATGTAVVAEETDPVAEQQARRARAAELRAEAVPPGLSGDAPRQEALEQERRLAADALPPASTWVSGRVTDVDATPLQDVVLTIPGTTYSALSGPDGRFRMHVPTDSLGPGTELEAVMIGYAFARREIPTGVGERAIDDLQLERRAVQLEGVVVTGTAIAAERRELAAAAPGRTEDSDRWQRVGAGDAEALLGARPLRLPGIPWTEIGTLELGSTAVVTVRHEAMDGEVVQLFQARSAFEIKPAPTSSSASRVTPDGIYLLAVGEIDRDVLVGLLDRAEPILDTPAGAAPR